VKSDLKVDETMDFKIKTILIYGEPDQESFIDELADRLKKNLSFQYQGN